MNILLAFKNNMYKKFLLLLGFLLFFSLHNVYAQDSFDITVPASGDSQEVKDYASKGYYILQVEYIREMMALRNPETQVFDRPRRRINSVSLMNLIGMHSENLGLQLIIRNNDLRLIGYIRQTPENQPNLVGFNDVRIFNIAQQLGISLDRVTNLNISSDYDDIFENSVAGVSINLFSMFRYIDHLINSDNVTPFNRIETARVLGRFSIMFIETARFTQLLEDRINYDFINLRTRTHTVDRDEATFFTTRWRLISRDYYNIRDGRATAAEIANDFNAVGVYNIHTMRNVIAVPLFSCNFSSQDVTLICPLPEPNLIIDGTLVTKSVLRRLVAGT